MGEFSSLIKIKRNQNWINKNTGRIIKVLRKATGNRHWTIDNGHHIHEGTLLKYYFLLEKN